ncbi:glycerate kinase type-2 family protein [Mariniblastus fucicola]|uniref:Hydroxypyruvate reductase n=1 Tax=Mariniblastus fucicola TaxID=980251 RepID=A0A5B9PGA7_9BACT|nr:DUF4147 domain-containing protein [Mariniblastus fucicola]QEG21793.1 Putative hydroxypyruvate reductase [Mariniblastus fucicola]
MIRNDAIEIWNAGVAAVHGRTLVEDSLRVRDGRLLICDQSIDLGDFDRVLIVGGGKFSHFMAEGIENVLGPELARAKQLSGLITVPDGSNSQVTLKFVESAECRPAGVNLPTQRVLHATQRMLSLLRGADERTLVIALISGGGSALLESSSLPLKDIVSATSWLSTRGADIVQLNTVRIALSEVKGGGLARVMPTGTLIGLIVSDVPNDDLRFVSSGPTVDFGDDVAAQARDILKHFGAPNDANFPDSVVQFINSPRPVSAVRATTLNLLIGDANVARNAAIEKAKSLGYAIEPDSLADASDCEQIAEVVADVLDVAPATKSCLISLGEPTVEPGDGAGQGGRNQHAVLSAIARILTRTQPGKYCFMSAGTDGEDGNTSVAGALVTDEDLRRLSAQKAAIVESLQRFDSYTLLESNGLVFESGPTATNVADLRILLRWPRENGC